LLQAPESGAESQPVCRPLVGADVEELRALLECQNLAAIDKFFVLAPALADLLGTVRFERLRDGIDNLDFQLGAALLREHQMGSAVVNA